MGMISYEPLWETMKKKNITTYRLLQLGINKKTLYNLQHGKNTTLLTIEKLCKILDCPISDVVTFIDN